MPTSFWKSQNPYNDPKVGWKLCCATVKGMVGYNAGPKDRIQIVREHGRSLVRQPGAAGFGMLDKYMALHKPVMTGVNHTYGAGYNEGTTDTSLPSWARAPMLGASTTAFLTSEQLMHTATTVLIHATGSITIAVQARIAAKASSMARPTLSRSFASNPVLFSTFLRCDPHTPTFCHSGHLAAPCSCQAAVTLSALLASSHCP